MPLCDRYDRHGTDLRNTSSSLILGCFKCSNRGRMNTFRVRTVLTSALIAVFLLPVYGHHGSQFLSKAMEMTATEVRLGSLATSKTSNPEIKTFAETLIADQNEVLRKLMDLRAARTVVQATPKRSNGFVVQTGWGTDRMHRSAGDIPMIPDHHRTLEKLSSLSTEDFDRQFVSEIIREHRETIAFFEEQTHVHGNEGVRTPHHSVQDYSPEELLKDLDTVDFATATLPALRHELTEAERLPKRPQKR